MLRALLLGLLLAATAARAPAGPPVPGAKVKQPIVRELGEGKYAIGLVTFDHKTRQISFPAEVNLREGFLEYAVVHQGGKIHESLLCSEARPLHINLALKLLRCQASPELFQIIAKDHRPTGRYPDVPAATRAAARFELHVQWKKRDGTTGQSTLNDWITRTEPEKTSASSIPWVYGGSYIHEGIFQAESSGDIAAIFTSNSALFNYTGTGHDNDEIWIPNIDRVPPVGTTVTVIVKPVVSPQRVHEDRPRRQRADQ